MTTRSIHHLVAAADYQAGSVYQPRSLSDEGFIHCTLDTDLLLHIANAFYRAQPGEFLVLVIDPERVTAEVRYEPPMPPPDAGPLVGQLFPHIYGPLNPEAVVAVRPARRGADGEFLTL